MDAGTESTVVSAILAFKIWIAPEGQPFGEKKDCNLRQAPSGRALNFKILK